MIYRFEDYVLDTERRELHCAGTLRSVEPQVFDLLHLLIRNRERVVSREDIFQSVWHGRFVSESVLSTRINAARNAIGDNGREQRMIRTLHRKGIRFVGAVHEEKASFETPAPSIPAKQRFAFSLKGAPAIVVLPFEIIGGDLKGEYFADGLAEELITALSKLGWFSVISRHSSFAYKGKRIALKEVARKLGVQYMLEGSVRQQGGRARIALQLIDGASDHHLWAECFDRDISDALGVQEDITEKVTSTIADQLYAAEDMRAKLKTPESFGAWECIVRALSMMNTREKQQVGAAHSLLKKAVAIDPKSAPAYSLLSIATTLGVHLGWYPRTRSLPVAIHHANKALALDGDDPWGHVALGYATIWKQPAEAVPILKYGLTLNPNLAMAHYLIALASAYAGECESVSNHANLAERLGPRDLLAHGNVGVHNNVRSTGAFVEGRYRDGIEFARKMIKENPRQVPAYRALVMNCALAGNIGEAKDGLKTLKRLAPDMSQQWIRETAVWARDADHKKYVEAFRMAGLE